MPDNPATAEPSKPRRAMQLRRWGAGLRRLAAGIKAIFRIRFSLRQLLLLVVLAAILVRAWVMFSRPSGRPIYSVTALAFSPDGKTLAANLYVYHQIQERLGLPTGQGVAFGANASRSFFLVDLPDLHPARLVERDIQPGELGMDFFVQRSCLGPSLAISPDGKTLATKSAANRVSLWDVDSGRKICDLSLRGDNGLAVATAVLSLGLSGGLSCSGGLSWAEDGSLAVASADGIYVLRPGATALEELGWAHGCVAIALSHDGTELVCSDWDGISLWDARSGARRDPLAGTRRSKLYRPESITGNYAGFGLAISPDGKLIAAGIRVWDKSEKTIGWGNGVRVWDAATGKVLASFRLKDAFNDAPAIALAFSPDGGTLAAADNARGPRNQAIAPSSGGSGLRLCSLRGGNSAVGADGKIIASGAAGATLPTNAPIASVAYSRDGSQIATGDFAGEVSLWDARTTLLLNRVSLDPSRDAADFWGWPSIVTASVVWLIAWAYVHHKRQLRANASDEKGSE